MAKSPNILKDIQGAGRLGVDAVVGITDLVEHAHHNIASLGGLLAKPGSRRRGGISGFTYQNIRSFSQLMGKGLDAALQQLTTEVDSEAESSPAREGIISALNGVLGDYLHASQNPLAINMQFRLQGRILDDEALSDLGRNGKRKLLIMVHGSCMNDLQWQRKGHNHGEALARDLGLTPLYLYYNTGLHISQNGQLFAHHLEHLSSLMPANAEIHILAHSMGGLVSRSACHYARQLGHRWPKKVKKMVFLGSPHHGAPLEKGGNRFETLLKLTPYSLPFTRLGYVRSSGITDLRYGNLLDEDWQHDDRFKLSKDKRTPVPLPAGVDCYAIASTIGKAANRIGDDLVGDGLVTVNSALGRHRRPEFRLGIPKKNRWIGRDIGHLDLLNHPAVYNIIKQWLAN